MDTPVVLSHRTAYLVLHARNRQIAAHRALTSQTDRFGISQSGLPARRIANRIRAYLQSCGIELEENEPVEIAVPRPSDRTRSKHFQPHVMGAPLHSEELIHIAPGLFSVGGELSFIQAATWMNPLELIEYGYELCGRYELDHTSARGGYRERSPFTTVRRIRGVLDKHPYMPGVRRARHAIAFVRDGSRSPMETALALAILLPNCEGGLGYRHIELNRRLAIPQELKKIITSDYLEVDIFSSRRSVGIEYDGEAHAELRRRTHDADRAAALKMLGVSLRTVTASHFANQLEFHRVMNSIAALLGVEVPVTRDFQMLQNNLRLDLIRSWRPCDAAL